MTPTDPLYASQWHLARLGNIRRIWDEFDGSGVHVGVYDNGIQYAHPDLDGTYDPSRHVTFNGVTYDGAPAEIGVRDHGTSVAGLIAAERNGTGAVGVAWGASLTGVNVFDPFSAISINGFDPAGFYATLAQSTRFDVVNHSWGSLPDHQPFLHPDAPGSFAAETLARWDAAAATGRGGLGTVVVKSAGNDDTNSNGDGLDAARVTVTVAAVRSDGFSSSYSNYGANILVSAPAGDAIFHEERGIVTTDLLGAEGYNLRDDLSGSHDHTDNFGGTSAAAPIITGVVSLMLDAAPGLGWRDVQDILAASATHTGGAIGGAPGPYEENPWFFNDAATWNGGGMHFSEDYGYGVVNAYNAVRMAEVWHLFAPAARTSANEVTASTGQVTAGIAIPSHGGTSFSFEVASAMELEFASLTLSLTHQFGDLHAYLVSPRGTEVMLLDASSGWWSDSGTNLTWRFGMEAFRGEDPRGTWTLRIEDVLPDFGDAPPDGTLHWIDLDPHGRAVQSDDVYHYTDEFGAMAGLSGQAGRRTLSDADGGTDWIDAAAVSGNATVNLNAGAASSLGGGGFAVAAGTVIEHAVTGDGNDRLTGNGAANRLLGMRGNDTISGGGGADTLEGGTGADSLQGGEGGDVLLGGEGNDVLVGGAGADQLTGGAGADRFAITALAQSGAAAADLILDFTRGADLIDVSGIAASAAAAGDQGFAWRGTLGFSGLGTAEARYRQAGAETILDFDTGNGGAAEMSIRLAGLHALAAGDLVL